jgi:Mg2+/Co2+ transporter CorB
MRWKLPTDGPKTLNGLLIEYLETIPETGTALKLADYTLEVLQTGDNAIKTVRIRPPPPAPIPAPSKSRRRAKALKPR